MPAALLVIADMRYVPGICPSVKLNDVGWLDKRIVMTLKYYVKGRETSTSATAAVERAYTNI